MLSRGQAALRGRWLDLHSPFDDPEVIAGQGTIGLEVMRQSPKRPDVIYLAVGGGGLIAVWPLM